MANVEEFEEREITNDLDRLRHSAAHIMAHAVKNLYPGAKFGIGPTIEDGFYYDIDVDHVFVPEDLEKIEEEMRKIVKKNDVFVREELNVEQARALFEKLDQPFKIEIIRDLGQSQYSIYKEGDFVDLCRGPHIQRTGELKAFKLMAISGAFWRGNQKNRQLQRIYGTAFFSDKDLKEHLHLLEEAKKRDHRKLGKELDLFSFDPIAPGCPFFHPKGTVVYNGLVKFIKELCSRYGYDEIITPQILDVELWHRSGHYENYKENMYFTKVDEDREFAVKPMNCPASTFVYGSHKRSYRELPLRFSDFGRLHRYEKSGALAGLTRVRSFCQDDAHIFCTPDQIGKEIQSLIDMIDEVYKVFKFENPKIYLSTRPEKRVGSDELWDKAEQSLAETLKAKNIAFQINKGDGAFYGPKIDFIVHDALKRPWQLGTIQLDFNLAARFELNYVGADNGLHTPVVIHRAVLGSIERFLGVLIEHYAGVFPFWLAPVQCILIPIAAEHVEYCQKFGEELAAAGIRFEVDARNESMGLKTREAQMKKTPLMLVAGGKELADGSFSVRKYGEKTSATLKQSDLLSDLLLKVKNFQ